MTELKGALGNDFTLHCFRAQWQQLQLEHVKQEIIHCPESSCVLLEQDFAEGYTLVVNDAAQSTYWSDKVLNIHVSVLQRKPTTVDMQFLQVSTYY